MTDRSMTDPDRPAADHSTRRAALVAAIGLLSMAMLAPFAQFGVLASLIVPTDAVATTDQHRRLPRAVRCRHRRVPGRRDPRRRSRLGHVRRSFVR